MHMKTSNLAFLLVVISMVMTMPSPARNTGESSGNAPQMTIADDYKIGGFAVGLQNWTFNRFSLMEAIEKTEKAGGRVIELYPNQNLKPGEEEVFDHHASEEAIEEVKDKLEEHDIMAINYGVVSLSDEEESRKVFEFAKKMGIQAVTSEPSIEDMDRLEELVKEFDIMLAIHNHPLRPNRPDYHHWDPEYVLSMVEGRDHRIGASADIGHWVRSDIRPVEGLRILEGRLISVHMVDVNKFGEDGTDVINGLGVADIGGVLDELMRQNFGGHISIEYAVNWHENVTDVAQNIGFIRGWSVSKGYEHQ